MLIPNTKGLNNAMQLGVKDIAVLTTEQLQDYLAYRHDKGLSTRSTQRALSAIRAFFVFLISKQVSVDSPVSALSNPKHPKLCLLHSVSNKLKIC